ncbi:MAG TPA: long-chain fatty acid--CoA ligase, partial [Verrucomicrobiales bacterium]|nr:long-chain fatty acid--CoA ligase [Verrucomicrobiales bacterium]
MSAMPLSDTRSSLHHALIASAEAAPEKTAIFWGDEEIHYGVLRDRALRFAGALVTAHGVKAGDRIGLWLKNCPEFVAAYYGILLAGGVVVPINNFLKPAEVEHILEDAGARLVLADPELIRAASGLAARLTSVRFVALNELTAEALREPVQRRREDLAVIVYTSGTTGRSKGAMLTHGNLLHNVSSCEVVLEAEKVDRFAVMLPLFHSFMMTVGMILPLTLGGSMVLVRSLNPPKNAIMEIIRHKATILPAVPQFFRALAGAGIRDGLPVRLCISGGAPLPGEILREFEEKMPIPLIEGYGLSEASPVVSLNPIRGNRKAGSIGVPIANVEVAVWDEECRPLGVREVGEIVVRGGNVMAGYWNQPEATAQALRDGWLLTGDIGYRDEDGYFFITDRKKD